MRRQAKRDFRTPTGMFFPEAGQFWSRISIRGASGIFGRALAAADCFALYTVAVVLIILWLLGFVTSYTMGGLIHVLLVIAVVMILIQVIQGRRL